MTVVEVGQATNCMYKIQQISWLLQQYCCNGSCYSSVFWQQNYGLIFKCLAVVWVEIGTRLCDINERGSLANKVVTIP